MAPGSVQLNYESLHEKFLASEHEVLHRVIDKDTRLEDLKSCIPDSESLLLILTSPEMNVPPWMLALEELKKAICVASEVLRWKID